MANLMEYRTLGRTGLKVSALAFGCGDVGGLMVRGAPAERERAIARAVELGINYLDTAPSYGSGESEKNLALPGRGRLDLFHLHNPIARVRSERRIGVSDVLDQVVPALKKLQEQGKIRFFGVTALGETGALHRVLASGAIDTAQVCFNLLSPAAGHEVPMGFPAHDFDGLARLAGEHGVGTIGIRVLAAGALSGQVARHPIAIPAVDPIASGPDYATDAARARAFEPLVAQGHAASVVEAAFRFAITTDALSTALIGTSDLAQLDFAAAAVAKGPLPGPAMKRVRAVWAKLAD